MEKTPLKRMIRYIIARVESRLHKVPFLIKGHWDYYHEPLKKEMSKIGMEIGKVPYQTSVGELVCLMRNSKYEFIYIVNKRIKLKGSDFFYGTDVEFDLQLYKVIRRNTTPRNTGITTKL